MQRPGGWYNAAVMIRQIVVIAVALAAAGLMAVACAPAGQRPADATATLTVFAAASLAESFQALATAFEAERPGVAVMVNYAGSQTLSAQLEHGAVADVFASADWQRMAQVKESGLLGSAPQYFAANHLAVATPASSQGVQSLVDLARPGVSVAIAAAEAPAGSYARESLELMAAGDGFPDDFAAAVLANVVTNETSVRGVAQKVALGEVDAGMIYETDARAPQYADAIRVMDIPLPFNPAAQYPIATLAASTQPELALAFIDFVQGDAAQSILRRFGFAPPANVACPCGRMAIAEQKPALAVG